MARTNYKGGYHSDACGECGSTNTHGLSVDSDTIACSECGNSGRKIVDKAGFNEYDTRYTGGFVCRVVRDGEVVGEYEAVAYSGYNDIGLPTDVEPVDVSDSDSTDDCSYMDYKR